jgi:hypothetical protein
MSSAINATSATTHSAATPNTSRRRQQFPLDYNDFTATPSGSGIQDDLVKLYSATTTQGGFGQSAVSSRTKKEKKVQSGVTNKTPQAVTPSGTFGTATTLQEQKMQEDPEEDGNDSTLDSTPVSSINATSVIPVATAVPSATPAAKGGGFMSAVGNGIKKGTNWLYGQNNSSAGDLSIATVPDSKLKQDEDAIDFK